MKLTYNIMAVGLFLCLLAGFFFGGYKYCQSKKKVPQIAPDTVYLYDTVEHYIPDTIPYYLIEYKDRVIRDTVFKDIDTAAILRDYYAFHYYTRTWEDSLIVAVSQDVVSENQFIDNTFSYSFKKPQEISVVNTTHFSRYVYAGIDASSKDIGFEALYAFPKGYAGLGFGTRGVSVKLGIKVFQLE